MRLVDRNAGTGAVFCGADASDDEGMGVDYYLEQRKDGLGVGTVCEACKVIAVPFAVKLARDLEAEGMPDEAEEYRWVASTLVDRAVSDCSLERDVWFVASDLPLRRPSSS